MMLNYELHFVRREIETYGKEYIFYRKMLDKYKQDTGEHEEVGKIRCLYHTEKGYVSESVGDFGRTRERGAPKLLTVFDSHFMIKKNDLVEVNGKVFEVVDLNNVGELNIVVDLSLEVVLDGWKIDQN